MKKVIVASQGKAKLEVAREAFPLVLGGEFEFIGVDTPSGVPAQPFEGDTLLGAENRLKYIQEQHPDADFWVSMEGGLYANLGDSGARALWNIAWILVSDRHGSVGRAQTAAFRLPDEVARMVLDEGIESGHAYDKFFQQHNTKGTVGGIHFLTDGILERKTIYMHAAVIALAQLKHHEWFS